MLSNMIEELRNCVKGPGGRPGFPYLIVLRVSVDIKQRERRDQDLCENRGGRPRVPILNSLHGLGGRKTT